MLSLFRRSGALLSALAAVLVGVLLLSACSGKTQSVGGDTKDEKSVTIGLVPFDEVIATSHLWKNILEKQGYKVTLQQLEVAQVYQGLASGQIDLYVSGVPITHKDYWARFKGKFVPVGQWYDTLRQGLVVPSYTGLKKVSELEGRGAEFNNEIVGTEAGSGLMDQTSKGLPKAYDMSGYTIREGSTPTMLAALDRAIKHKKPIAVTLWRPHWAFSRYDLTLLEDDRDVYPANDTFHLIVSRQFNKDSAVMKQFKRFHLNPDQLQRLMLSINQAGEGKEEQAVKQWIAKNQKAVNTWTGDTTG